MKNNPLMIRWTAILIVVCIACTSCAQISLNSHGFMPHGYCLAWDPALVSSIVVGNLAIGVCYFAIPAGLWYFARNRKDLPYRWMFKILSIVFVGCGLTHLMKVWTLYQPFYWAEAFVDVCTAGVSLLAAPLLWQIIPKALALKGPRELEAANLKLQQSLIYNRSLIEASIDPLIVINPLGIVTDVNEATIKATGLPGDKLIGTDFCQCFTEPDKAKELFYQAFAAGSISNYPLTIVHTNGELTDVLYNASPFKGTDGNIAGVFIATRDVSALKKTERELEKQREKELERLAELEKFQKLTVGRELKMVELKKEIEALKNRVSE